MTLFVASGANCRHMTRQYTEPRLLPAAATLDQVVHSVNENTARVQSLQTTQATLKIPGAPALRANVAMQAPRRLRFRADAPFRGQELDLGSNDEQFWLWVRSNPDPALFVCRHDQFAMSNARSIMPVDPEWLMEAMGLVPLDPTQPLEGPTPVGGGRLQIVRRGPSTLGDTTKVTVIDEWTGAVVEQHLYDAQGKPLATARISRHQRDPRSGAVLPHSIAVEWPTAQFSFQLDVSDWQVNLISPDDMTLWTKPIIPGLPEVDLSDPNLRFASPNGSPAIR